MQRFARSALVLALLACPAERSGDAAAVAAAASFTLKHATHKLHATVAGSDCRVLLISIDAPADRHLVESIHYGTGGYEDFGGVEQFARDHDFRAVVYRDVVGGLWTYGATTRDEARSIPRCR
jgi:hypothetical protein